MTRMTGPDCVVMCNLINTHTHTVGGMKLHLDNTAVQKGLSDRMLGIKGSPDHSRWTCVHRPSCSVDKKWPMAKNGSTRCFFGQKRMYLKTIATENVVGRI